MNRAFSAAILALSALALLRPATALGVNGAIAVERWTATGNAQVTDPDTHIKYTHYYFRRELFNLRTDGTAVPVANYGIYDYKWAPGQPDDDSYAITARQNVNYWYLMVDYQLDTDPDKASFVKASAPFTLDSPTDAFKWVTIGLAPSSPTTALDAAWNLLQSAYTNNAGDFSQLSQTLIGWRAANFAGMSYNDQLQFAQRASAHGLLSTNVRQVEATLRAAGFPIDLTLLLPADGVDLALTSVPTYAVNGSNVTVSGINLKNNRATQTGQVLLDLYAFPTPYFGGGLTNARLLASNVLATPIDAGASASNISFSSLPLTNLPNDSYYLAMLVSDGAATTDHFAFRDTLQIGPIGGVSHTEQNLPTQLASFSTLAQVGAGENTLYAGINLNGTASKKVIIRALGASSGRSRLPGGLPGTSLQLWDGNGLLESNTGWSTSANSQAISDSGFAPARKTDSAIIRTLPPGSYTAVINLVGGGTGLARAEMYDLDRANLMVHPLYILTRARVTGARQTVNGTFTIGGSRSRRVIVRALGPSLVSNGVSTPLANPQLTLQDANGNAMYTNNGWQNSDYSTDIAASGRAPTDARESAIIATLAPGTYTAVVSGPPGQFGVGQFDLFDLQ
jgi:hypothetical protein